MIVVNLKPDIRTLHRDMTAFHRDQMPFVDALALTTLAKGVQGEEREQVIETFDKPTRFTENAFAILPATKSTPIAVIFPKDIQAEYLAPFVDGGSGMQELRGKRGMLVPKGLPVNAYGNIPKGKVAQLKAKPNVFVGSVKAKDGRIINGVWQRPTAARKAKRAKPGTAQPGHLKLLIRFSDPAPVKEHLDFFRAAEAYLRRNARKAFEDAYAQAIATKRVVFS
ncbi:hypothetical protein [Flavisphingomonas formosensis]|uniref:hypothetical protein n=1 Tax=Flavisphingomonas formosensis TaxID=861534 RepID=UPI0012FCCDE1|nr:hypothetical protein [Sphingomonas formosensis]